MSYGFLILFWSFVVGSNTKCLRIFNHPINGALSPFFELPNLHDASIYCVDYSPSGNFLATGSNDKIVKILKSNSENEIQVISEMSNHDGTIRAVKFLPGGSGDPVRLASGGAGDGRVYLTDIESSSVLKYTQVHQILTNFWIYRRKI